MELMEPEKPVKGKKRAASTKTKTRKGLEASVSSSAHVIDLRSHSKPVIEPTPVRPKPVKPTPASRPEPKEERPVERPKVKAKPTPEVPPIAPEADRLVAGDTVDIVKVQSSRKRFWGAFLRFIFLLILLGGVVFGGVYLYLTLYHQG